VSELAIHLRKDARMLMTDPMFIILVVALAGVAFIIALVSSTGYVNGMTYGGDVVTEASLQRQQTLALANYWGTIAGIFMAIFTVIASLALTGEKESGMVSYLLTYRTSKLWFYTSKFLVLLSVVALALMIALAAYLIVFSVMDVPMLDAGTLAASMVFPTLVAVVFAAIGLLLSTLSKKKAGVIVAAVALFFLLSFLSSASIGLGVQAAYQANPHITAQNVTEYIPLEYKLLIYGNPLVLTGGTSIILGVHDTNSFWNPQFYDLAGGVALGLGMTLTWFMLGLLSFSRERMDKRWSTVLRERLRTR